MWSVHFAPFQATCNPSPWAACSFKTKVEVSTILHFISNVSNSCRALMLESAHALYVQRTTCFTQTSVVTVLSSVSMPQCPNLSLVLSMLLRGFCSCWNPQPCSCCYSYAQIYNSCSSYWEESSASLKDIILVFAMQQVTGIPVAEVGSNMKHTPTNEAYASYVQQLPTVWVPDFENQFEVQMSAELALQIQSRPVKWSKVVATLLHPCLSLLKVVTTPRYANCSGGSLDCKAFNTRGVKWTWMLFW